MQNYEKAKIYITIAIDKGEESSPVILEHMSEILFELGEIEESEKYKNRSKELRGGMNMKINDDE